MSNTERRVLRVFQKMNPNVTWRKWRETVRKLIRAAQGR